jgi:hypothetical protein
MILMALDLNKQGNLINYPKKEWTAHSIDEFPVESDTLSIPHGSYCTLVATPDFKVYTYDSIAKEWFEI